MASARLLACSRSSSSHLPSSSSSPDTSATEFGPELASRLLVRLAVGGEVCRPLACVSTAEHFLAASFSSAARLVVVCCSPLLQSTLDMSDTSWWALALWLLSAEPA